MMYSTSRLGHLLRRPITTPNEVLANLRRPSLLRVCLVEGFHLPFQVGRIQRIPRLWSNSSNGKSLPEYLIVDQGRILGNTAITWSRKSSTVVIQSIEQEKDPSPPSSLADYDTDKVEKSRISAWLEIFRDFVSDPTYAPSGELELFRTYYEPLIHKDVSVQNTLAAIDHDDKDALRIHFETAFQCYLKTRAYENSVSHRLVQAADIRNPHIWYPMTRRMRRKIIYHYGPTNSGKTYSALNSLKKAQSGVYCAPLRLLAAEIYERLNFEGIYCNLITGQERRLVPNAHHYSMTVEMAHVYISEPIEVAVIDEIQMMADENRGYAWTEALFSLEAKEIHVCGNETALELMKLICAETGDEFEAIPYSRLTNLTISKNSLNGDLRKVREGDCLIVFSRKQIFEIRQELESKTSHRCCVVYGSLPPEVRVMQARLFNDPESRHNVLVASDAVGMGLNL
jgi:hypothetical protein